MRARKAFTLIEILIVVVILGILAAIVIPQFTSASEEAQASNAQTQMSTIRNQIELYRVRNNGTYPPFVLGSTTDADDYGWLPLVHNVDGQEYMRKYPINPRTNSATIVAGTKAASEAHVVLGDPGWVWDAALGEMYINGFDEELGEWVP